MATLSKTAWYKSLNTQNREVDLNHPSTRISHISKHSQKFIYLGFDIGYSDIWVCLENTLKKVKK